jgi:SAM-dependent methyltransferase
MEATDWDDRYRATERLWSAEPNIFVEDRLADRKPGAGLDLASGEGRNAIWLAERGWEMTAVDFSPVAVERGRANSTGVEFVVGDVLTWNPDRSYDLVLIAYLHLPLADFEPLIRRAADWLQPGGELFMIGHDRTNIEHGVGGPQYPEVLWDVDEIVPWLEGLEVMEAGVVEREVEVDHGLAAAIDTLIRARRV